MPTRTPILLLPIVLALLACGRAAAETIEPGQPILVVRADGRQVKGVLEERTETHLVVALKFGSVKIPLDDVAEEKLDPKGTPALPRAPEPEGDEGDTPPSSPGGTPAEDLFDQVLEEFADSEFLDALKSYERLVAATADPFLADVDEHRELLEEAAINSEVNSLETLGELLEIMAERACPRCGGPGELRCKSCKGHGEALCDLCKGKGISKCTECRGKGKLKCPKCHGSARMDCDDCGPNDRCCCPRGKTPKLGKLRRFRRADNEPPNNRGQGRFIYVDCAECTNAGKDTCDTCDGNARGTASGYVQCRQCRGEKKLRCERCHGNKTTGTCVTCRGEKSTPCSGCEGTGLNDAARAGDGK